MAGEGVTADHQAVIQQGLDVGATYFRSALGRDLPPVTVYVEDDVEGMAQLYAATYPAPIDAARGIWATTTAMASTRRIYVQVGSPSWSVDVGWRLKIAAHEAFHLLQFEVTNETQWIGGLDDVRPVGPWWLAEGAAEYFAHLAVAERGALPLPLTAVRTYWEAAAKASAAPLRSLETMRGQQTPNAFSIYPLAVELLVKGGDPKAVMAYFESVGSGVPWPTAFAVAFGRSAETFYNEFEAYRIAL